MKTAEKEAFSGFIALHNSMNKMMKKRKNIIMVK